MAECEPIAERDYPPGCRAAPPLRTPVPVYGRSSGPQAAAGTSSIPSTASTPRPTIDAVWSFVLDPNDTSEELYNKRRKRYAALLRYYQQRQEHSEKGLRPDLEVLATMKQENQAFDWDGFGGAFKDFSWAVGDFFCYKTELYVLGLHKHIQKGIASTDVGGERIGESVVASGGYEDDEDHGEKMVYTGQGGKPRNRRQMTKDQVPEGENLALMNSCKEKAQPVRVVRGHSNVPTNQSPSSKIYAYDGLYNVVAWKLEPGNSGFKVFKFKLERVQDQHELGPELGSRVVAFVGKLNKGTVRRTGVVMADISNGQEPIPVVVVNTVDTSGLPSPFVYTRTVRSYPGGYSSPSHPSSQCSCQACSTDHHCSCAAKNYGGILPYNQFGQLVRVLRSAIYECGKKCGCSQDCPNRVCQNGLRYRLEIFKTENKGWGVRSWDFIPAGGFICEYTGDIIDANSANKVKDDKYLFTMDYKQGNVARWGDRVSNSSGEDEQPKYVINASNSGGVARFINHSCKPNLFVQCVLYNDCDPELPHVMLFASQTIRPFQELTYDYGYAGNEADPRKKPCYCDARNCRKWMY